MALDLTTLELVKVFANIPVDTTSSDTTLELLISGTSDQLATYLDRNFEQAYYNETFIGEDSNDITLNNYPVTNIIYSGYGLSTVIDLVYDGVNFPTVQLSENSESIILNDGSVPTEVPITILDTLEDIIDELNLVPSWTATIATGTGLEKLPAQAITEIFHITNESSDEYTYAVKLPLSPMQLLNQTSNGLWKSSVYMRCGMIHTVLYQGGYAETADLPLGLQQLVAQIVAGIFRTTSRDITLKSEKVGDYAYVNDSGMIQSYINSFATQLLLYKNVSV